MSQTEMVLRVDQRNEKIVAGLFLRVCLEVDMSQSLKYELKYYRRDEIKSAKLTMRGSWSAVLGVVLMITSSMIVLKWRKGLALKLKRRIRILKM